MTQRVGVVDRVAAGIAWRDCGPANADTPPIVFLHGLGGTRESWGPQLDAFGATRRCIAWDMPGYGASDPVAPLTYPAIVQRLVDLLDLLALERVDLVGLSFGGMHALHTVLAHPGRIRRLVLADTSPAFGMDGTRREDWVAARLAPIEAGRTPADIAPDVLDAITATPLTGDIRAETIAGFARIGADGFRAAVRCLPDNDVRAELHRITAPTLVIVGALDAETPPSYAEALHRGIAGSTLRVVDGAGHLTPAEAPDAFNALVAEFLAPDHPADHPPDRPTPDRPTPDRPTLDEPRHGQPSAGERTDP